MGKTKKIFITGAAGFIGFHTALALKKRGDLVVGYDNFNSYYSPSLKRARASRLADAGIEVIEGNLTDTAKLKEIFNTHCFTHALNLAAQAGVRYALKHPQAYVESNLTGFVSLLEVLRGYSHVKLIYASSSSVYGRNTQIPFSEKDRVDEPANLYAATKKANELIASSYHHLFDLHATGLRYFTVYGPWGRPDMAYYSFTEAILEDRPITLFNEGKMERDFTYIDDAVAGTVAAIDKSAPWAIYNIGNNHPVSVLDFVALLEEGLGKKAKVILGPSSKGEVKATFADIEKSQKELGFNPKISLKEGLAQFFTWYSRYPHRSALPAFSGSESLNPHS